MKDKDLSKEIERIVKAWYIPLEKKLQSNIRKRKLMASEDLLKSFKLELQEVEQDVIEAGIRFNTYGRILEMKNVQYAKMIAVKLIEEWVRKIGVQRFNYIPNNRGGNPLPNDKAINRIAWGVARAKKLKNTRRKNRSWYAKTMFQELQGLEVQILDAVGDDVLQRYKNKKLKIEL